MKLKDIKHLISHREEIIVVTDTEVITVRSAQELKELTQ